jgi:Family of unknown function (DUF6193)
MQAGAAGRGFGGHDWAMTDPSRRPADVPAHYPDVAAVGDLRTALQAAFGAADLPHCALHVPSPGWLRVAAKVRADDRHANVLMATNERLFLLDFWMRGVRMATGKTNDLHATAAAISTFLSGVGVRQFAAACAFVKSSAFAEAFERGEAEAIAHRWQQYRETPPARARHMQKLHEFLTNAAHEPQMRALFPFTSHQDLGLRRSVTGTNEQALAWVRPFGPGRSLIAGPDRRQLYSPGPLRTDLWGEDPVPGALGPADAKHSVALVLTVIEHHAPR